MDTVSLLEQIIRERSALIGKLQREVDGLEIAVGILRTPATVCVDDDLSSRFEPPEVSRGLERDALAGGADLARVEKKIDPSIFSPSWPVPAASPKAPAQRAKPVAKNIADKTPDQQVVDCLRAHGCGEGWRKVTYQTITEETGLNALIIRNALYRLENEKTLRVHKVAVGPERGNHFTFSWLPFPPQKKTADVTEPPVPPDPVEATVEAPAETAAPLPQPAPALPAPSVSDLADEILGYLAGIAKKVGVPSFQLPHDRIMAANKCNFRQMLGALDLLAKEGQLTFKLHSDGRSYNFVLKEVA